MKRYRSQAIAIMAIACVMIACSGGSTTGAPTSPSTPNTPNTPSAPTAAALQVQAVASSAASGAALSPQPVVRILDAAGALVTTGTGAALTVTAALSSGSGALSGATSATAVAGIATFANLVVTGSGAHTLRFTTSSPSLATTSAPIAVTTPPPPTPAGIAINVGATATASVGAGADLVVPITLDLSNAGTTNLASIAINVTWNAAQLSYQSNAAGNWTDRTGTAAAVTVNTAGTATGTFSLAGFTPAGTTQNFTLRSLTFRGAAAGAGTISVTVTAAGNELGSSVTVTPRNLSVTVVP